MAAHSGYCPYLQRARHTHQVGFSLVELLVVMIVIVLATSVVTLSLNLGGDDTQLESQVRDLAATAEYALDEAQFTGLDYGLRVELDLAPGGDQYRYRWQERRIDGWQEPATGKELFGERKLPVGVRMELELENAPSAATDLDAEDEVRSPQVVMYSSGEATVGAINLRSQADSELLWRIEWDLLGRVKVLRRGELEPDEGSG